ncbi:MAG: DUF885 domain-containing protein [Opitutaceae bacterium]|jgi:uncharacterized protein (DUF885 family)|nr:DUF885 domain-containing protein [Opitutaceae bacterium]
MRKSFLKSSIMAVALFGAGMGSVWAIEDLRYLPVLENRGHATEADRLALLLSIDFDAYLEENPTYATSSGYDGFAGRWDDDSAEGVERQRARRRARLAAIESIAPQALGETDRLNYDLFLRQAREQVELLEFPTHVQRINQRRGVQQRAASTLKSLPNRSVADLKDQVALLRRLPEHIDQHLALLREGVALGVVPPAITLRDVPQQVRNMIVDTPEDNPLLQGFYDLPSSVPGEEGELLRNEAIAIYRKEIRPKWQTFEAFLTEEYLPAAPESVSASDRPNGVAWYRVEVQQHTTLDISPDQVHEIGLAEVARIRGEMERVKAWAEFDGTLEAFFTFLRTAPQFYHTEPEALLAEYRDIAKRADFEMPKLFGILPRTPYGIIEIPSYAAKSQTTAYYMRGSLAAGRAGQYFANTYALNTRPRWEMEALTLHEAVPGHHHQIAIQQEIEGTPGFRKMGLSLTGYTEGWGLYAESLGEEMGFYQDPYAKFGQLTYEMWRAVRLVVDTGMHAKGWSRQQAIDYFAANASKSHHDIVVEIDRYISWPGQALAYKLGELKFKELKARAAEALGEKFDIRDFHDEVLRRGPLPLMVLDHYVDQWIASQR